MFSLKRGIFPLFIFQRNVWKTEPNIIDGMSLAWVHRDWNNSPDADNMPQAAQYNINCKTQSSRKYKGDCVCVWQCRVQWALLFHTPSSMHLLKLLRPLCCCPYLCGMKCDSCWEDIDGLLPHLLKKPPQQAVLHLSVRAGYGLELQEQIHTVISKIAQRAVCAIVVLSRKFYHIQTQEKIVKGIFARRIFRQDPLSRHCARIAPNNMDNKYINFSGCLKSKFLSEQGAQASSLEHGPGNH